MVRVLANLHLEELSFSHNSFFAESILHKSLVRHEYAYFKIAQVLNLCSPICVATFCDCIACVAQLSMNVIARDEVKT